MGMCRNGQSMDIAAPRLPSAGSVDIAAEESVEPGAALVTFESRSSTPGTPPAHKREPPDMSDRARFPSQLDAAASDAASSADAHDAHQQAAELFDPAEPAAAEQQRLDPEAAPQPQQPFLNDQARSEDGPPLCRSAACTQSRAQDTPTSRRHIQGVVAPQAYATAQRRLLSRSALTTAKTMKEPPPHPQTTMEQVTLLLVRQAPSTMPSGRAKRNTMRSLHLAPHTTAAAASHGADRRAATAALGPQIRRTGRASAPR